jgi:hypothetical protein
MFSGCFGGAHIRGRDDHKVLVLPRVHGRLLELAHSTDDVERVAMAMSASAITGISTASTASPIRREA